MLIAHTTTPRVANALILGLSRENVNRLTAGQPILIHRDKQGDAVPEGWEILICFGETELALHAAFERSGAIGPHTLVTIDPRLKLGGSQ